PFPARAFHQKLSPVETRRTSSPGRVPFSRKAATADLALRAPSGDMWLLSKTMTKVRPRGAAGPTFVATGQDAVSGPLAEPRAGSCLTTSKLTTFCSRPSSRTVKSSAVSPPTVLPSRRATTTSTVTWSTAAGNVPAGGDGLGEGRTAGGAASTLVPKVQRQAARAAPRGKWPRPRRGRFTPPR